MHDLNLGYHLPAVGPTAFLLLALLALVFRRFLLLLMVAKDHLRWRPYRVEYTGSLLTSEVKRHRAWLVLGWGTAWEHLKVLSAFFFPPLFFLCSFGLPPVHAASTDRARERFGNVLAHPGRPAEMSGHCRGFLFLLRFFPHVPAGDGEEPMV